MRGSSRARERLDNLRAQIDSDVRTALLNLQSSADQVERGPQQYRSGGRDAWPNRAIVSARASTDTVEVVQSQEAVASAHEQYISSLYSYNFAKISLARALGIAEEGVKGIFQRKMNMAEENPPRSIPGTDEGSPESPQPLTDRKFAPANLCRSEGPQKDPNSGGRHHCAWLAVLFLWRYLSSYESTDDAQADVHLYPVSARISGYVVKVNVDDNQWVQKGTVLVEIDPKDYEVAVAQAQANLASAEATAQSLNITVPITSVSTSSQLKFTASDIENANAGIIAAERQVDRRSRPIGTG